VKHFSVGFQESDGFTLFGQGITYPDINQAKASTISPEHESVGYQKHFGSG